MQSPSNMDPIFRENVALAMAYVPMQQLDRMYPPIIALSRGTLYPDFDKPFEGMTVMGGRMGGKGKNV